MAPCLPLHPLGGGSCQGWGVEEGGGAPTMARLTSVGREMLDSDSYAQTSASTLTSSTKPSSPESRKGPCGPSSSPSLPPVHRGGNHSPERKAQEASWLLAQGPFGPPLLLGPHSTHATLSRTPAEGGRHSGTYLACLTQSLPP